MDRIGRYVVERRLGTGAFATVWLGYDEVLDGRVAIKVLADNWTHDPDVRERFVAEARWLWRADDPHIVRVYNVGELDNGQPYFVMEYADRGSLDDRLDGPVVDGDRAIGLVGAMAACVGAVHEAGAIHRDVKPANFLLSSEQRGLSPSPGLAGDERLLIVDLGLAKSVAAASGFTMSSGSSGYMAPEQRQTTAGLDTRADLFALGVVAFELLTGASPLSNSGVVEASVADYRPDFGGGLDAFFARALHRDPSGRPDDAATLAAEFAEAMRSVDRTASLPPPTIAASEPAAEPVPPVRPLPMSDVHDAAPALRDDPPQPPQPPTVAPSRPAIDHAPDRRRLAAAAGTAVVIALAGVGVWSLTRSDPNAISASTTVPAITAPDVTTPEISVPSTPADDDPTTTIAGTAAPDPLDGVDPDDTLALLIPLAEPALVPGWFPLPAGVRLSSVTRNSDRIRIITEELDDPAAVCAEVRSALAAEDFLAIALCPTGAGFGSEPLRWINSATVDGRLAFDMNTE